MAYREFYEVRTFLPGDEELTSFFFEKFEQADIWLSDFDNGEIHSMVIDDSPEMDYEEMNRLMESIEAEDRYEETDDDTEQL